VTSSTNKAQLRSRQSSHADDISPEPLQPYVILEEYSKAIATTTHRFDLELERSEARSFFGESSGEPDIAEPVPIAPPNHVCDWKDRYLALAAEIRQLKAKMATHISPRSSESTP
jgi:hypothetical protein